MATCILVKCNPHSEPLIMTGCFPDPTNPFFISWDVDCIANVAGSNSTREFLSNVVQWSNTQIVNQNHTNNNVHFRNEALWFLENNNHKGITIQLPAVDVNHLAELWWVYISVLSNTNVLLLIHPPRRRADEERQPKWNMAAFIFCQHLSCFTVRGKSDGLGKFRLRQQQKNSLLTWFAVDLCW